MAELFDRFVEVVVYPDPDLQEAGSALGTEAFSFSAVSQPALLIRDLRIRFRIRFEATPTPAEGEIEIYNLSVENEKRVREVGTRIQVNAGYEGSNGLICDGDIRHIERERQGLDRITKIHFGGQVVAQAEGVFDRSYEGAVAVTTVVSDAVAVWPGISLGPLDAIPADAMLTDYVFFGLSRNVLTNVLDPLDVDWYEQNRVIRFRRRGQVQDATPDTFRIATDTGMIGTPTTLETDEDGRAGIRVRTLLNYRVNLADQFTVESEVIESSGPYAVVAAEFSGDSRGTDWYTEIEGRGSGLITDPLAASRRASSLLRRLGFSP